MEDTYYYAARYVLKTNERIYFDHEEEECAKLLEAFSKMHSDNEVKKMVKEIISRNYGRLDYDKLFEKLNLDIVNDNVLYAINTVLKNINYDYFVDIVNKHDNPIIVGYYYKLYGKVNKMPKDVVKKDFIYYIEEYINRKNIDYNELLEEIINYRIRDEELQLTKLSIINDLLDMVTLDKKLDDELLEYIIDCRLDEKDDVFRKYLNKTSIHNNVRYHSNSREFNPVEINLLLKNIDMAIELFNNDGFTLYSSDELRDLLNKGYYGGKTEFKDELCGIVKMFKEKGGYKKDYIFPIIYSSRVKVISYDTIEDIKEILDEDKYNEFMLHIIDDNIRVYINGLAFDNNHEHFIITEDFFNTKIARRTSGFNHDRVRKIEELLDRRRYVNKTK